MKALGHEDGLPSGCPKPTWFGTAGFWRAFLDLHARITSYEAILVYVGGPNMK